MAFTLPELPFAPDALAPHMSAETFSFHHGKHHQAYITKLNQLIEGTEFATMTLEQIMAASVGKNAPVFNNAAQHWNHSFFWNCLAPAGKQPSQKVLDALTAAFGSFDNFKAKFAETSINTFGSGWGWLVKNADGTLAFASTSNAGCPLTDGKTPILTCDVWEHAYYVDHRNARPAFLNAFWNIVNWDFVEKNLGA
ncbi:MAG: superoxide dismutase [Myxococcales bacterium]|nr:superoxide dismutase [Myxococcales bacterium]